jgi:hypothetical protein
VSRDGSNTTVLCAAWVHIKAKRAKLAEYYMEIVHPLVSQANRSQDYIINMDQQTPVPFTFNAKTTWWDLLLFNPFKTSELRKEEHIPG